MKRLRLAVVGAGRLGGFHAQKLAQMEDVDLVGVIDPVPAQCKRVAAQCATRALADPVEIMDRLDAAVIAAPTRFHHQLGMEFLDRGIHLLVEKPLSSTFSQADQLVRAARQRGVVLQVGHVERFNPALAVALPHVPEPKYIDAVRAGGFTFRSTDIGVVLDLMIHDIDLVLSMVRSPLRKVEALGLSVLGGHEDVANARLEFQCGCVATLSASRVSHRPVRRMDVWSLKAYAGIDFAARTATLVRPSEALLQRRFDVESLSPRQVDRLRDNFQQTHLPCEELEAEAVDAIALELTDFLDSIRTPRAPRVSGDQARDAIAVAEQILAKIHTHAWDNTADGPVGPLARPRRGVIPAPHWHLPPERSGASRKEAG